MPWLLRVSKPLNNKNAKIRPRITKDDSPPLVTMPRKIRSDSRGLVVMSRFSGTALGLCISVELTVELLTNLGFDLWSEGV